MTARSPEEALTIAEDRVVTAGRAHLDGKPIDGPGLLEAAQLLHRATRTLQACCRWAAIQRIGPGGIAHAELSLILSAAARGDDWKTMKDKALDRRKR